MKNFRYLSKNHKNISHIFMLQQKHFCPQGKQGKENFPVNLQTVYLEQFPIREHRLLGHIPTCKGCKHIFSSLSLFVVIFEALVKSALMVNVDTVFAVIFCLVKCVICSFNEVFRIGC